MGKKFMGLGGTDHFWDRAKAWILNQITSAVAAKIAEIVADAPEDLDTLKEIADWISAHADDAAAMNTQITENKNNIAALSDDAAAMNTAILANTEAIAGKADKVHTHTKSQITDFPTSLKNPNALTVNGKTYDGSSAVNAGVQTVANGGTGATDAASGFNTLADGVRDSSTPADDEKMLLKPTGTWYKTTCLDFWNYIKGKISSVLGLTKDNYGGKADTAGNADTVDNYHASQLWRSDGATWNPRANVVMTPSGNDSEWSFDFRNKNGVTGTYWQVWDENKQTLLKVDADSGEVSAPYGFVGNLSGKANTAGTADNLTAGAPLNSNNKITTTNPTKIDAGQIKVHTVYNANGPATYGNLINIGGNGGFQFFVEWTGGQTQAGQDIISRIFTRSCRDTQSSWTAWKELAYNTGDVTFTTAKASSKMVIPIGAPSQLEDGCIWIER